jgi:hypothetical protein
MSAMTTKSSLLQRLIKTLKRWIAGRAESHPRVSCHDDDTCDRGVFVI